MSAFYTAVLALSAALEIAVCLSPERMRDPVKRVAALAALLCLLSPLLRLWQDRDVWTETFEEFADAAESPVEGEDLTAAAEAVFRYAESLGIGREGLRLTFETGEDGHPEAVILETDRCPYALRGRMESELTEAFGVPVVVKGGISE